MKYSDNKNFEKKVSLLGFGCMRFPALTKGTDDIDEEESKRLIDYAYKNGVTYFDTAYYYHGKRSEVFIGSVLKNYERESFSLATKLPVWELSKTRTAEEIFNEQLKNCQVEYFDFYLCHALNKDSFELVKKYDVFNFLLEKKAQGKIRHIGFSFHDTPDVLEEIAKTYPWEFAQIQLNYVDWELQDAKTQYEILHKYNIPIVVMEPVRGGALAGFNKETDAVFYNYDKNSSVASWAFRYVASLPGILTVLSGMSDYSQVVDNVKTFTNFKPLTEEEKGVIDNALKTYKDAVLIPCTGCRYCMDCPHGVDIPAVFKIYNNYKLTRNKYNFRDEYKALEETKHSDKCKNCKLCVKKCPQHIDINERLSEITKEYKSLEF